MEAKNRTDKNIVGDILESLELCTTFFQLYIEDLQPLFCEGTQAISDQSFAGQRHDIGAPHTYLKEEIGNHIHEIASHLNGIVKHVNMIRDLKSQWNSLSPVSCLPPELLSRIFLQRRDLRSTGGRSTYWHRVSHVCRHWRMVALDCAELWTSITTFGCSQTGTFLSRSKQATLSMQVLRNQSVEELLLLVTAMPRIATLHLEINYKSPVFVNSAPMLQSLKVDASHDFTKDPDSIAFSNVWNESNTAPRLQKLVMVDVPFVWPLSFRHANMRDLRILDTRRTRGTLVNIRAALESMPLLEILSLNQCLPNLPASHPGDRVITLNRLRSITISDDGYAGVNLLSHLDVPSDLSIRLLGVQHFVFSPEPLESWIAKFIQSYPLQHLCMHSMTVFRLNPVAHALEATEVDFPTNSGESFMEYDRSKKLDIVRTQPELIFSSTLVRFARRQPVRPILGTLPLSQVVVLTIMDRDHDIEIPAIVFVLEQMPRVQTLHLYSPYIEILEALCSRSPGGLNVNALLLPQLQRVKLDRSRWCRKHAKAEEVIACLRKRREAGYGIDTIEFLPLDDEESERMAKCVREVNWDQ